MEFAIAFFRYHRDGARSNNRNCYESTYFASGIETSFAREAG
jgi:hypothetical protein